MAYHKFRLFRMISLIITTRHVWRHIPVYTLPIASAIWPVSQPATLLMAMPGFPSTADMTLMVSSGADVPRTMTKSYTKGI